jgi:hypothetical protein
MIALRWILRQFWRRSPMVPGDAIPTSKVRVSPRQNPFAFRRALLREAVVRLKRLPLGPSVSSEPRDQAGSKAADER